jgi:hypothetical protein
MQATARRLSVVSATSCARHRLIRDVRQKQQSTKAIKVNLPRYNVALWYSESTAPEEFASSILRKARLEPYESTAYQGIRDLH